MSKHTSEFDLSEMPVPQHKECRDLDCRLCLDASWKWKAWAEKQVPDLACHDALGRYHAWLAQNGIRNELHGWMSPEAFDPDNVRAFLSDPHAGPEVRKRERQDACVNALANIPDPQAFVEAVRKLVDHCSRDSGKTTVDYMTCHLVSEIREHLKESPRG